MIFVFIIAFALLMRISPELAISALIGGAIWLYWRHREHTSARTARDLEQKEKYKEAQQQRHEELLVAAQSGDIQAQFEYGECVLYGHYCPADPGIAAQWLKLSADGGFVRAQERLADLYKDGKFGIQQDSELAMHYFKMAAAGGSEIAAKEIFRHSELRQKAEADEESRVLFNASPDEWVALKAFFEECESEPERLLLMTLVHQGNLKPANGRLENESVLVEPQKRIQKYRVDFLVNRCLVVEVDGKQYHNNATSFETDRLRDQDLILAGYQPIRFTANQVYSDPIGTAQRILHLARSRSASPVA